MPGDDRVPSTEQVKSVYSHVVTLIRMLGLPPIAQDVFAKMSLMMAVSHIEVITHEKPFSDGENTRSAGWITGTDDAFFQLRRISTEIRERWGMTFYRDLAPYPGNPCGRAGNQIPDFPLTFTEEEIQVLAWVRSVLIEALDWVSRTDAPTQSKSPPLRLVGGGESGEKRANRPKVLSVNEERDTFLATKFEAGVPWKEICQKIKEHPGWRPLTVDAACKAYRRFCKRHKKDRQTRMSNNTKANSHKQTHKITKMRSHKQKMTRPN
jgi:hypothetical protein